MQPHTSATRDSAPLVQGRFWPLAVYLALTLVGVAGIFLFVVVDGDVREVGDYWSALSIPLGVPWSIVPLLLDEQLPNVPNGLLTAMLAVSVPLNVLLLYLVGRRIGRARSAPTA